MTDFTKEQYARALAELTDCFLERHRCFPLDNPRWREAMSTAYTLIGQPGTKAREDALAQFAPKPAPTCEHCGCKLATYLGGLEYHAGDCPNLPF